MKKIILGLIFIISSLSFYGKVEGIFPKQTKPSENQIISSEENVVSSNETNTKNIDTNENGINIQEKSDTNTNTKTNTKDTAKITNEKVINNKTESNIQLNNNSSKTENIKTENVAKNELSIDTKQKEEKVSPKETKKEKDTLVEEYRVNNTKINEMKNIINNNVSADMKEFGYSIVVDPSIVNLSNYFTFTEKRVKSKVEDRFGTIKIYARDLYVNGGYAHTECFIY